MFYHYHRTVMGGPNSDVRWFHLVGLVDATVTARTAPCRTQLVNIVEATVLYVNFEVFFAIFDKVREADFYTSFAFSLVWQWIVTVFQIQPSWEVRVTSICSFMFGWHFCSCSSFKTIPVFRKSAVTFTIRKCCDV